MTLFISYARRDEGLAKTLAKSLEVENYTIWYDQEGIRLGANWPNAIDKALKTSETMILLISPAAMQSKNVADEWQYFLSQGKQIIPILIEPTELHYQLHSLNYVDFYAMPYEKAFEHLLSVLSTSREEAPEPSGQVSTQAYNEALAKIKVAYAARAEHLDLSNMGFVAVPPEIGDLEHLRSLRLNGNQVMHITDSIGRLHHLRELWLNDNQIHVLPRQVTNLRELRWLSLASNRFTAFPTVLLQLRRLQVVRFGHNDLQQLPAEVSHMAELMSLFLGHNQLDDLPKELGQLANLVQLEVVEQNPLEQLPPEVVASGDRAVLAWLRGVD